MCPDFTVFVVIAAVGGFSGRLPLTLGQKFMSRPLPTPGLLRGSLVGTWW